MRQTICFHALQTLPIEQQRRMVKRLQLLNEQCDDLTSATESSMEADKLPKMPQVAIGEADES